MRGLATAALLASALMIGVARAEEPRPVAFADLPGWAADDHAAALAALKVSCGGVDPQAPKLREGVPDGAALTQVCARAAAVPPEAARSFFEDIFQPVLIGRGRLTGYYEPEIEGSLKPDGRFDTPLLARPDDLVSLDPGVVASGLPAGLSAARRTAAGLEPFPTRAAIEDGALAGRRLELLYADRINAFFTHVQGSARVRLADGTALRIAYDGKNGWPFTAIGRLLVERGIMTPQTATMASIRAWLADHEAEGRELMRQNKSYIFFRIDRSLRPEDGPRGAQKTPLTAGRSLAVDQTLWPYGLPVFVAGRAPDGADLHRLLVAQDTGSAILGPARGDLFVGSGDQAGAIAGAMRDEADFYVLLPKIETAR
ncbi:murein transglycosylase A [Hansschlegelia quercus]|uniref:peptidoglycan lytic exotransglycosylase n=1 Tax=Hansschlegelia quercus TaxID=2528245 RepID=A0A4Q9GK60_9HYPH|nr:MltA domain-containing protein [Hansschlegelia quercus]TBN53711.1 lytic murein transglycosylase [Hansschlegelia quercus]